MKATSGPWLAPAVGVVVHDDVARADLLAALGELAEHPLDVARDGPGLEGVDWADSASPCPPASTRPAPKSSDSRMNRRVRHPHELVAHLGRDVLQRALDDADGDRVHPAVGAAGAAVVPAGANSAAAGVGSAGTGATGAVDPRRGRRRPAVAHGDPSMVMMRLPASSARAVLPGGMDRRRVALQNHGGTRDRVTDRKAVAEMEDGLDVGQLPARSAEGPAAGPDPRRRERFAAAARGAPMVGVRPTPTTRTFTISMGLSSKTCPYSARCCSWKRRNSSRVSAGAELAGRERHPELVALADVSEIARSLESDPPPAPPRRPGTAARSPPRPT